MATFKDQFGNTKELDADFKPLTFAQIKTTPGYQSIVINAASWGITPEEYVTRRGGLNKSGYFGDSYGINTEEGVSLTDEEYAALGSGPARNAALAKKVFEKTGKLPKWWGANTPGFTTSIGAGSAGATGGAGGGNLVASDGTKFTDQAAFAAYETGLREAKLAKDAIAAEDLSKRQSAYDLLFNEFTQY